MPKQPNYSSAFETGKMAIILEKCKKKKNIEEFTSEEESQILLYIFHKLRRPETLKILQKTELISIFTI